jgi:hypothetical protein
MVSFPSALRRIKDELADLLTRPFIEQVCREAGHSWRRRVLDPVTTIHLFILQVLHHNTACSHLSRLTGKPFSASAYCQARARLPLKVVTTLAARVAELLQQTTAVGGRWHGHRTVLLDGSGCSMPDTPDLQRHFGQPGAQQKGCGFPVAHLLTAFDAHAGLLLDVEPAPLRTHDLAHVSAIHPRLRPGDLLVADRGFCSFAHLALIQQGGMEACLRMHQMQIVSFRPHRRCVGTSHRRSTGLPRSRWLKRLGPDDQMVEWPKPKTRPSWISVAAYDALPESIRVRELRYRIRTPGFRTREVTLVTTLLDPVRYPARELAELYRARWEVEINLRHLKTTLGLDVLHCQTVDGVLKELWMFVLVYNLVRAVMFEAARRQRVAPQRISFFDALRWLVHAAPDEELPALLVNPDRRDRIEPRVIKRRMKEFPLMKKPRTELRQALLRRRHAA